MTFVPAQPNTEADVALFARKYVAFQLGLTDAPRDAESYCHRCHTHVCKSREFPVIGDALNETVEIFRPLMQPDYRVDSEYDGHWLRLYLYSQLGDTVPL